MLLNRLLIKTVAPVPKIEKFKTYLFVAPHPDDIEIAVGSTVARLAREGKDVYYLVCTDGRFGTEDENMSPETLVKIRRDEQLAAAKILGVKDVRFLPFEDGGMYDEVALRIEIAKVIAEIKPDVVIGPDHKLYPESHPDHLRVGEAVSKAYFMCSNVNMMKSVGATQIAKPTVLAYYFTGKPNKFVKITKKDFEKTKAAYACFVSQCPPPDNGKSLMLYMRLKVRLNGLRSFHIRADAFRVMNNMHIHCCGEAEDTAIRRPL